MPKVNNIKKKNQKMPFQKNNGEKSFFRMYKVHTTFIINYSLLKPGRQWEKIKAIILQENKTQPTKHPVHLHDNEGGRFPRPSPILTGSAPGRRLQPSWDGRRYLQDTLFSPAEARAAPRCWWEDIAIMATERFPAGPERSVCGMLHKDEHRARAWAGIWFATGWMWHHWWY